MTISMAGTRSGLDLNAVPGSEDWCQTGLNDMGEKHRGNRSGSRRTEKEWDSQESQKQYMLIKSEGQFGVLCAEGILRRCELVDEVILVTGEDEIALL